MISKLFCQGLEFEILYFNMSLQMKVMDHGTLFIMIYSWWINKCDYY